MPSPMSRGSLPFSKGAIVMAQCLVILTLFSSLADKYLSINFGGFNLRYAQVLALLCFLLAALGWARCGRMRLPPAFGLILIWYLMNVAFLPNSIVLSRGIMYVGWMALSLGFLLAAVNFFRTEEDSELLIRWYIRIFAIYGFIGLVQWLAYYGAGISILNLGQKGRIEALSHEPSFFAGQQLFGYMLIRELTRERVAIFSKLEYRICAFFIIVPLVLSTSKIAYVLMMFYELFRCSIVIVSFFTLRRVKISETIISVALSVVVAGVVAFAVTNINSTLVLRLLAGSGIGNTAAHSVNDRMRSAEWTIQTALDHPLIGISYGGVGAYMSVLRDGGVIANGSKLEEPLFMPAEISAATGIVGFLIWLAYMGRLWGAFRTAPSARQRWVLKAMSMSAMIGFVGLESNFPRGAIWSHLAVWSVLIMRFAAQPPGGDTVGTDERHQPSSS